MDFSIEKIAPKITAEILKLFPDTKAIIVWGSCLRPDFYSKSGDVDLIIVTGGSLDETVSIQTKLKNLIDAFTEVEVDPSATNYENLGKLFLITSYNTRQAHGIDRFIIKHNSSVIYGDEKILDLISGISIDEAIRDVAPHIRNEFIAKLSKEVKVHSDATDYVCQEKDKFIVIIRTLFTLENKKIGSKKEVLEYLGSKYSEFSNLANYLKDLCEFGQSNLRVDEKEVSNLLNLVDTEINEFLEVA